MSDDAHAAWAAVVFYAVMMAAVVACVASVAWWAQSPLGLWSLLVPLLTSAHFGNKD